MSESKHTPGPWKVEHFTLTAVYGSDEKRSKVAATVAGHAFPDRPLAEAKANARLIAAAPDMLASLKSVREALTRLAWDENTLMINGIDAAIRKAEGR